MKTAFICRLADLRTKKKILKDVLKVTLEKIYTHDKIRHIGYEWTPQGLCILTDLKLGA